LLPGGGLRIANEMMRRRTVLDFVRRSFRDRQGATAIEYALIAAGIAGAIAVAVGLLGQHLGVLFQAVQGVFP
jgi:Flp pilus assembly pilin Flp